MWASPLLDWMDVISSSRKFVTLLGILAVLTLAGYGLLITPYQEQEKVLKDEGAQLDHLLDAQAGLRHQRARLSVEVAALHDQVESLRQVMGLPVAGPQAFSDISRVAKQTGLFLTVWKPGAASAMLGQPEVVKFPVRLEVEGNYHGLGRFLDRLAKLPKVMVVQAFSISSSQADATTETIQASLDLLGFEGREFFNPSQSGTTSPSHGG